MAYFIKADWNGLCFSLQDKADLVACNWRVNTNEGKKAFELEDRVAQLWSFSWQWRSRPSEEEACKSSGGEEI